MTAMPTSTAFDFDQVIDRRASDSAKWAKYAGRDILPLWVADMDFAAPPAVLEALRQRIGHGVFGYPAAPAALADAVCAHLAEQYDWAVAPDWLVWLPGLVCGLNVACRAVDGGVLTATPIYPPFLSAPHHAGRPLTTVALVPDDPRGRWGWDWAGLEAALGGAAPPRLFLFCHPHNPVGRAWDDDELDRLAALAEAHDLIVCSDEIHCGLVLAPERRHRPFASLGPALARRTITLMAPSKTFNIPGLGCAFAVIPDPALRRRFTRAMRGIVPEINVLGLVAAEAALRHGGDWHAALLGVLRRNRDRVQAAVAALPGLSMRPVEATCLAWIDARGLGVADPAAHFEAAGIGLSDGAAFGAPGFVRLNFGCPLPTLEHALERLARACR